MREASVRKIMLDDWAATKEIRLHDGRKFVVPNIEYYSIGHDFIHIHVHPSHDDHFLPFTAIASITSKPRKNGNGR